MARKLLVLFEDDWELRGNGLGNVADLQYLPARFLLDIGEEFGLRFNFMVEVLQQLAFRRHAAASRDLRLQADLWDHTVQWMKAQGHDVQLHLHPQWRQAA